MRILKDHLDFKELVSRVLAFDYIGALVASLLFPIFLVPQLGLVRTSLVFGMLNAAVGCGRRGSATADERERDTDARAGVRRHRTLSRRLHQGRPPDHARRGCDVRRRHRLLEDDALPAHRRHAKPRRLPALPQRQFAVQFGGRIPLSRGARPSGDGARLGEGPCAAPRARPRRRRRPRRARGSQVSRRSNRSRSSTSTRT